MYIIYVYTGLNTVGMGETDVMFSSHSRSWVMMVPRKWNDSTVQTRESQRVMGAGVVLLLKSEMRTFY